MRYRNWMNGPIRHTYFNFALILIGINVFVFFVTYLSRDLIYYLAMNPINVVQNRAYWQVITYMFAHANISHILFNMLALFFFGFQVEQRMGSFEFMAFYLICGVAAGLFSLAVYWFTGTYRVLLLGASGAVYAVLLAFATYFPTARIYIMGVFPVRAPYLVIGYTVIELFSQLSSRSSGVAHLTHLAGFGAAFLYFVFRLKINPVSVFLNNNR